MLQQGVMMLEPGPRGLEEHCMTHVTRYLLVRRVEKETNNGSRRYSEATDQVV